VPDGDPEGVRIIDRMNWTDVSLAFPRSKWPEVRQRPEFLRTGVYIPVGYRAEADDLPTLYLDRQTVSETASSPTSRIRTFGTKGSSSFRPVAA
jgi:hypothetical protein